jgi:hypothetical protein
MLYIQPPQVFDCISGFNGIDDARTLYCKLLNYDYQDLPIPTEDWTKSAKEIIIDGKIIAKKRGLLGCLRVGEAKAEEGEEFEKGEIRCIGQMKPSWK